MKSLTKSSACGLLIEASIAADPLEQFSCWFAEALSASIPEPSAMTLATVGAQYRPDARIVLLKEFDACGFVFYTNYLSHKGQALAHNPHACLLFYWAELERQVRIEGAVEKTSAKESDAYYHSRLLTSRIGAWVSEQSAQIADRRILEERAAQYRIRFGEHPPRPPHWGGYRLKPDAIEFWQARPARLHDRIKYLLQANGEWRIVRLCP